MERGYRRVRLHHFLRHGHRRIRGIRRRDTTTAATVVAILAPLPVTNSVIAGTSRIIDTVPDATVVAVPANTSERSLSLAFAITIVPAPADIVAAGGRQPMRARQQEEETLAWLCSWCCDGMYGPTPGHLYRGRNLAWAQW